MPKRFKNYHLAIFNKVANEILLQLQRGTRPWQAPWVGGDGPRNHRSLRFYTGLNELSLLCAAHNLGLQHHRWLSANQARAMGGLVRHGERGTTIFVSGHFHPAVGHRNNSRQRAIGYSRLHIVFNVVQCDGIRQMPVPPRPSPDHKNRRIERLVRATGIEVRTGGVAAFYNHAEDFIQVPPQAAFFDPVAYYRTLLHEVAHALMAPSRLNVRLPNKMPGENRAWAEVVSELVSAFVCRFAGIQLSARPADYIGEWLSILRSIRKVAVVEPRWVLEVADIAEDVATALVSYDR
jgi:antirestriction protein ArdC